MEIATQPASVSLHCLPFIDFILTWKPKRKRKKEREEEGQPTSLPLNCEHRGVTCQDPLPREMPEVKTPLLQAKMRNEDLLSSVPMAMYFLVVSIISWTETF